MHNIARKITIPAQPTAMMEITQLLKDEAVDYDKVIKAINKDIGLVSAVLKTVNTPIFSRGRKINSIAQAVNILGVYNMRSALLNASLKAQFSKIDPKLMHSFWRHSELIAIANDIIARRFCPKLSDFAYITGLFHDCAVPLLMQKYDDYFKLFKDSMQIGNIHVLDEEEKRYHTNHCVLGSIFCESWFLPKLVSQAVLHHHTCLEESIKCCGEIPSCELVEKLVAILITSDKIIQNFDPLDKNNNFSLDEWISKYSKYIELLEIDKDDMLDIREDFLDKAFA